MIRVERGPMPQIAVFTIPSVNDGGRMLTKAEGEAVAAQRHYDSELAAVAAASPGSKPPKIRSYNFKVYKDPELSAQLIRVFGTKCAYCESDFRAVTPKEVEHFRPKSAVDTGTGDLVPGYYWLAASWENLLLSCVDCNRQRKHEVPGQSNLVKLGKEAQFPLADETKRFRGPGPGVGQEEDARLLIDPCTEEPSEFIVFDDDAFVHPRLDPAGAPILKGDRSIVVYALMRKGLVETRKVRLLDLQEDVIELAAAVTVLDGLKGRTGVDGLVAQQEAAVARLVARVKGRLAPGAEYVAMKRDWIRAEKVAKRLDVLERAGIDLESLL